MREDEEEEKGEVRLGVTCAKEIRPPHSILSDRPRGGLSKAPKKHTPPSITLPFSAIVLSLGHQSVCLFLHLYHTLHHPLPLRHKHSTYINCLLFFFLSATVFSYTCVVFVYVLIHTINLFCWLVIIYEYSDGGFDYTQELNL